MPHDEILSCIKKNPLTVFFFFQKRGERKEENTFFFSRTGRSKQPFTWVNFENELPKFLTFAFEEGEDSPPMVCWLLECLWISICNSGAWEDIVNNIFSWKTGRSHISLKKLYRHMIKSGVHLIRIDRSSFKKAKAWFAMFIQNIKHRITRKILKIWRICGDDNQYNIFVVWLFHWNKHLKLKNVWT